MAAEKLSSGGKIMQNLIPRDKSYLIFAGRPSDLFVWL